MKVDMSQQPTLSVLIPNYNHARFLPELLGSILEQSYRPMEIIIIDDASTDNSVEVIEEFARQEPRLRLVRNERNMGVEHSVNKLLEMASGDYVFSPAADDKILPGFFEKSITLLAQYPQAGLCSTVGRLIDENGNDRGIRAIPVISNKPRYFSPEEALRALRRYGRWIDAGSVIYQRDALKREGGYFQELGSFADTFANLVLALRYGVCYIPEPLACWRQMATGYASRSATDWEGLLKKGRYAARLMRTTYSDLFPKNYVEQFERRWMYVVSVSAGKSVRREQEQTMAHAFETLCPEPSFVDRVFWTGMRLSARTQAMAWRLYSMARFGPWREWILGRLSILVNLRKLVITEKSDT